MSTRSASKNLALFGALCLFLSAVEYMIPKPMPFMRIGLSNLPLMLALDIFPFSSFAVLICVKVFGQALVTGTLFSYVFLFSAAGTVSSALLMFTLRRVFKKQISFVGIGTAGAMVSNAAQLALAWYFIFGENTLYIAPPFLLAGLVTGIALGVFCEVFVGRSEWYKKNLTTIWNSAEGLDTNQLTHRVNEQENRELKSESYVTLPAVRNSGEASRCLEQRRNLPLPIPLILFIIGLIVMLSIVFNPSTEIRVLQFLVLWLLAIILKKKTNPLITVLIIAFIVLFNLLIPYGRVLYSIGWFKITSGALRAGIHRAVTLQGLFMLSKLTIRADLKLPGAFGNLLSEALRFFSSMMSGKIKLKTKNIISGIDEILASF